MKSPQAVVGRVAALLVLGVACTFRGAVAQPSIEPRVAIQALTDRFLAAFENLDLDRFMACLATDATVFFPTPEPPERFDGQPAIRDHFQQVFAAIRHASSATSPPYHRLRPEELEIQVLGSEVGVVTFHLRDAQRTARRTLVVSKVDGVWLVRHLHASNVPMATSPAAAPATKPDRRR